MRLLLVEDDLDMVRLVTDELEQSDPPIDVTTARSRSSAETSLRSSTFDLILCDLKIPVEDGGLDAEVVHGLSVFGEMQRSAAGTPILFFSAYELSVEVTRRLLRQATHDDPFGSGESRQMLDFVPKDAINECLDQVRAVAREISTLNQIEIDPGETPVTLSDDTKRVLRLFARRQAGRVVRVNALAGGLSSGSVLRLRVRDASGALVGSVVAKSDQLARIRDEKSAFESFVSPVLPNGSYTPLAPPVLSGAGNVGALFYTPVPEGDRRLFDLVRDEPNEAVRVIDVLRTNLSPWLQGVPSASVVSDRLREDLLAEDELAKIRGRISDFDFATAQSLEILCRRAPQHGDLHIFNVLIDDSNRPVLIDFGRVGNASGERIPS